MKGKINEFGTLELMRGNAFRPQACTFRPDIMPCGDWCPFFDEAEKYRLVLRCAHNEMRHEITEDKRNAPKPE